MKDGFIKAAAASPPVRVADCRYNVQQILAAAQGAARAGAQLLVTPELGLTASTCGDLFLQRRLLQEAVDALETLCRQTADLPLLLLVGLPLGHRGKLYNCAAVLQRGRVLGLVPKSCPPNHGAFYELRHFAPAFAGVERFGTGFLAGVPIGVPLLFHCQEIPAFCLAVEIGQDLWMPAPPSVFHAAAGAAVIANLSAGGETAGMAERRRSLVQGHSRRLVCAYVYAGAGSGESSGDLVFAGHNLLAENGAVLASTRLFSGEAAMSEIDLERLAHDRRRITCFPDAGSEGYLNIRFSMPMCEVALTRRIPALPFVPAGENALARRCETILAIQAAGLQKRMEHTGAKTAIVGVSGGWDSTLALLVVARAFHLMGRRPLSVMAVTMPGFGTTRRTLQNAEKLCAVLGVTLQTIDITGTTRSHFADIAHPEHDHSVVFENAQARVRTLTLMDLANKLDGLVIGTGDLSELALGWATYNGDHMSMYAVNASVPKTLIRPIIAYAARASAALAPVLQEILDTPVSPELLPPENGEISQRTEEVIGPYELHDFTLYYMLRWGFSPRKIYRLAQTAFAGKYDAPAVLQWMRVFYRRFFSQQFKRSCLPDGPKVGSVCLSPRGDWRMPSDAAADAWLRDLDECEAPGGVPASPE